MVAAPQRTFLKAPDDDAAIGFFDNHIGKREAGRFSGERGLCALEQFLE